MGTKADPGRYDCHAAAADDEPMFVLRANDPLAPDLVRAWAARYLAEKAEETQQIAAGGRGHDIGFSNAAWKRATKARDKITEALAVATEMEEWRRAKEDQAHG